MRTDCSLRELSSTGGGDVIGRMQTTRAEMERPTDVTLSSGASELDHLRMLPGSRMPPWRTTCDVASGWRTLRSTCCVCATSIGIGERICTPSNKVQPSGRPGMESSRVKPGRAAS